MFTQNMEMLKRKRTSLCLIAIFIIASLLRLWSLQLVPPSPSLDEVSIGYNAFSLLHTGRDEYGNFLPLLLRAYDDWRPIFYVYLTVPFVAVFGLDILSVRLPSVILSLATVFLSFSFIPILFKKRITVFGRELNLIPIGIITAILVSISPWHIYLSRLGHEVNLGLFITVISVYMFLLGVINQKKYVYIFSTFLFGISFYTYQSQKIIIPVLLVPLIILFFKEIQRLGKNNIFAGIVFFLVAIPAFIVTLSPEGMTRFSGTSIFSSNQSIYARSATNILYSINDNNYLAEIYYNRRFVPVRLVVKQYLSHFNPRWLFMGEFRENHKVPYLGLLYLFEAPFLILGLIIFLFSKIERRVKIFFIIWFLSSPLPGAITTDAPHAMRSYTFIPTIQILESFGLLFVFSFLRKNTYRYFAVGAFFIVVMFSLWKFSINYFFVFSGTQADSFQSTLFSSMLYVDEQHDRFGKVVISNEKNLYQSYMFYLFASKYDPVLYLSQGGTRSGGFAEEHVIGDKVFRPIRWNTERKQGRIIYVGNKEDFGSEAEFLKRFDYPNGKEGVYIVSYD